VVADGRETVFQAVEVRIVNGTHQGGVAVTDLAHPDTGDVVVQAVIGSSRWVIAREWARIVLHLPLPAADRYEVAARDVLIETEPAHDIAVDGEVLTATPAAVTVARNALLVFAPAGFDDRH
jgi:diacylglycerol kinase family enzyme